MGSRERAHGHSILTALSRPPHPRAPSSVRRVHSVVHVHLADRVARPDLSSCPSTSSLFAPPFVLTYTVTVTLTSLSASLGVLSPKSSTVPLSFQALLHAYFRLPTSVLPPAVRITPLGGKSFVDKVQGGAKGVEGRAVVDVDGPGGEVDRVYFGVPDSLELSYEGVTGGLEVTKVGLSDVVVSGSGVSAETQRLTSGSQVWNPGPTKGAAMGDMEDGGASRYVCLGEYCLAYPSRRLTLMVGWQNRDKSSRSWH